MNFMRFQETQSTIFPYKEERIRDSLQPLEEANQDISSCSLTIDNCHGSLFGFSFVKDPSSVVVIMEETSKTTEDSTAIATDPESLDSKCGPENSTKLFEKVCFSPLICCIILGILSKVNLC